MTYQISVKEYETYTKCSFIKIISTLPSHCFKILEIICKKANKNNKWNKKQNNKQEPNKPTEKKQKENQIIQSKIISKQ